MYITRRASDNSEGRPCTKFQSHPLLSSNNFWSGTKVANLSTRPLPTKEEDHPFDLHTVPAESDMADGKNDARAIRVLELMNDFRTLQTHVRSLVSRSEANPPDQQSYYLDGYVVFRQCNNDAQALLAVQYDPGSLGIEPGRVAETEVQKATLQRIILDASSRRFSAHKIYMRAAAATRWAHLRAQVLQGQKPNGRHVDALRTVDTRLREELRNVTDASVYNDLRQADRRKAYWLDEDPTLDRMLAWIRRAR